MKWANSVYCYYCGDQAVTVVKSEPNCNYHATGQPVTPGKRS